jgi:DNA-binding PadR family transcriptional regulator
MGHHWPGIDSPNDDSDEGRDEGRSHTGSWGNPWMSFGPAQDHRRTGRRGPSGPPPWLQEIFGFGAPQRPANRGPRVKRGDVRTAIIDVLHRASQAGESLNGYQVIQQISDLSGGEWRPSPGSVYPTIQQLQDEGLVESDDDRGRRTIRLSTEGTTWASDHASELAAVWAPFQTADTSAATDTGAPTQGADIKSEIAQVMSAVWQLVTQGSDQQRRAALEVLVDTRRRLYGILADGRDGEAR